MFYKILMNYFRLKLLKIILNRLVVSKFIKTENIKTMSLLAYGIELLKTFRSNKSKGI